MSSSQERDDTIGVGDAFIMRTEGCRFLYYIIISHNEKHGTYNSYRYEKNMFTGTVQVQAAFVSLGPEHKNISDWMNWGYERVPAD